MIHFADWLGHWSVDVFLLGSILLTLSLIATTALHQPVHRLAITKSLFAGLALLAALSALPGWSVLHLITAKPALSNEFVQPVLPLISPAATAVEMPRANFPPPVPIFAAPLAPPRTSFPANINIWVIIGAIEFIGSLAVLIWLATGWATVRKLRRAFQPAPPYVEQLLKEVAQASSSPLKNLPKLHVSRLIEVPVALGLRRPTIALPHRMVPQDSELHASSTLAPILTHELAHIRNRDLQWLALSRFLLILFWSHPLFWFARRRMRLDQESLADAAAADLTTREQYAEQLVCWARNLSTSYPTRLASAVGLWEGASQLRQRVALLLDERITVLREFSRKWQLTTLSICTLIAAALSLVTLRPAQSQVPDKVVGPHTVPTPVPGPPFEKRTVSPNSIALRILDENGQPVKSQLFDVYRINLGNGKPATGICGTLTNNDGTATVEDIIHPDHDPFRDDYPDGIIRARPGLYGQLAILVKAPGHASWLTPLNEVAVYEAGAKADIRLHKSATLKGRVTDKQGKPIAKATVSTSAAIGIPDYRTATTDNEGYYEIADESAINLGGEPDPTKTAGKPAEWEQHVDVFKLNVIVRHPDFAEKLAPYSRIPSTVDVQLERGGTIEGRVVLQGKDPRPINVGARLRADPLPAKNAADLGEARLPAYAGMDEKGYFRIGPLLPGHYSLHCEKAGWFNPDVNAGLPDIEVRLDKATSAPDLELTRGSIAHVQLIDGTTHRPVSLDAETRGIAIIVPEPGTNGLTVQVPISANKSGQFDVRMPPGRCGLDVYVADWSAPARKDTMVDVPATGSVDIKLEASNTKHPTPAQSSRDQTATKNKESAEAKPAEANDDGFAAVFQTGAPAGIPNTIDGQCVDETGNPLAAVEILLVRTNSDGSSREEISKQTTGVDGQFHFAGVVDIHREYPDNTIPKYPNVSGASFQIVARKSGRESFSTTFDQNQIASSGAKLHAAMGPSATLRGRITNPAGQPVAGALVSVGFGQFDRWEGFQTVRTKTDGTYEITDAPMLKLPDAKDNSLRELQADPPSDTFGLTTRAKYQKISVTQTDYADRLVSCQGIPGTQDIQLKPATIIRGRVLDATTNKPIAGTRVFAMPSHVKGVANSDANFASVTPDAIGEYQIHTLPAGTYDLWATGPDRVNKGIKNFKTSDAQTTAPDLMLTPGGMLRVRLVNTKNAEPIALGSNDYAQIIVQPSAPYNPVGFMTPLDGRFSIRVIPGDVQVMSASATSNGELRWLIRPGDVTPAHVDEGQTTDVDVRLQKFDAKLESKARELVKRGMTAQRAGDDHAAQAAYDEIIKLEPTYPLDSQAYYLDAHLLATSADASVRDGKRAIELAEKAIELERSTDPLLLDTLAAAYAETGDFDRAIETQKKAIDVAIKANRDKEFRPALKLYESHQPRQPKSAPKTDTKQSANTPPIPTTSVAAATLTGQITDSAGRPISGATVSVSRDMGSTASQGSKSPTTTTDPDGIFKLEGLQPFDLVAHCELLAEQKKRSPDGNILFVPPAMLIVEASGFATKQVAAESIPGDQNVQLERPAIVEGRVLFEGNEKEAGNVQVQAVESLTENAHHLYSSGSYVPLTATVHTDSHGKYRFTTLPPGSFYVFATAPDWATDGIASSSSTGEKPTQLANIILTKRGIDDSRSEENKQKLTAPILATMAKNNGYELTSEQDIRRVAPPFAPVRLQYYKVENALQADVLPDGPDAMTFLWNNGELQYREMFFTGSQGYTLPELITAIFQIPSQQIEGPSGLLHDGLPGDWVIRKGADETALTAQLQQILQTEFDQPVKLRIATVERPVYIARGNYTGSPVPASWAQKYEPRPRADLGATDFIPGEGPNRVNLFLNWAGDWIRTPIISEVKDAPMNIAWRLDELRENIKNTNVHDAERVIANLNTQTGIEFKLEKRAIKMLFVERVAP